MTSESPNRLQIREYPILLWIFGGIFLVISAWMVINQQAAWTSALFFLLGALFVFVFGHITTILVDKEVGTLTIRSQSLLRNVVKEYALHEIASVYVETNRDSDGATYRVTIGLTNGESVPFHSYYTSGLAGKERLAQKLGDILNLPEPKEKSHGLSFDLNQVFQTVQEGATQEVTWRIEKAGLGTAEVTRWITTATQLPSGFLLIVQKPKNSQLFKSAKYFNPISRLLYEQVMKIFGFYEETTPWLSQASPIEPPEPRLDPYFETLTSDPFAARQILTPWFVIPLVHWAEKHPLNQVQPGGNIGQLTVLLSPQGLKLAWIGEPAPELVDELVNLGVELVKTHGG